MNEKIMVIVKLLIFLISFALVFIGQKTIGKPYLAMQLVGIIGMLFTLWDYNRKYV